MALCFSAMKKQSPGGIFDEVHIFDVLGLKRAGCVAGWFLQGAAGTRDKAPVPCRAEEVWCRGKGVQAICTHCIQEHQEQ